MDGRGQAAGTGLRRREGPDVARLRQGAGAVGEDVGYWTRFATQGDPNGKGAAEWPAYTREAEPYLVFDMNLERGERLDQEHCDALEKLGL